MISPLRLERPGLLAGVVLATLFVAAIFPLAPLAAALPEGLALGGGFVAALRRGLGLAGLAALGGFTLGWPAGTLAALYRIPAAGIARALLLLPLVVPSFVWALAWADAGRALRLPPALAFGAMILAQAGAILSLVAVASQVAAGSLTASQRDALRLAGGEPALRRAALRHTASAASLAAAFGALVALSDPGPALVFGVRTAAYDVLTSFAATHDAGLAARQCLGLLAVALALAVPFACFSVPRLGHVLLERVPVLATPVRDPGGVRITLLALGAASLAVIPPLIAIVSLATSTFSMSALALALQDLRRTALDTVLYGAGAALVAVVLGLVAALAAGRSRYRRTVLLGVSLALLALPPAAGALGLLQMAGSAPAVLDPLLRGRSVVALALGLRMAPLAALLSLRALSSLPPSWGEAAALHGLSLRHFLVRVVLPWVRPALLAAAILAALLATADAPTVLLLHPPGHPSLPLTLLTVMSNAPQAYVTALVAVYLVGALLLLAWLTRRTGH